MKSCASPIQTALYNKLTGTGGHSYVKRWYAQDAVPGAQRQNRDTGLIDPYGIIMLVGYDRDDAQSVSGADHNFQLHFYASSDTLVQTAAAAAEVLLDNASLTLSGSNAAWWVKFDTPFTLIREDTPDARISHGIQNWRIRTVSTA